MLIRERSSPKKASLWDRTMQEWASQPAAQWPQEGEGWRVDRQMCHHTDWIWATKFKDMASHWLAKTQENSERESMGFQCVAGDESTILFSIRQYPDHTEFPKHVSWMLVKIIIEESETKESSLEHIHTHPHPFPQMYGFVSWRSWWGQVGSAG